MLPRCCCCIQSASSPKCNLECVPAVHARLPRRCRHSRIQVSMGSNLLCFWQQPAAFPDRRGFAGGRWRRREIDNMSTLCTMLRMTLPYVISSCAPDQGGGTERPEAAAGAEGGARPAAGRTRRCSKGNDTFLSIFFGVEIPEEEGLMGCTKSLGAAGAQAEHSWQQAARVAAAKAIQPSSVLPLGKSYSAALGIS